MIASVTVCSANRLDHLVRQQAALIARHDVDLRVLVWLDVEPPPLSVAEFDGATIVQVPPGPHGLRLAAGRNAGAAAAIGAGASLLVFLDADCIPGGELVGLYRAAASAHPGAVLCGPVTYLPASAEFDDIDALLPLTAPHPARPAPPAGTTVVGSAEQYPLFWSLSFALTASTWAGLGGFDERYEGYGGEDTDFAYTLRDRRVPLVWVGGAHAYHQYHPTSTPPWQHLDDILRNGRLFADRWNEWPMTGWLERFEAAGAVARDGGGWVRTNEPAPR